MHLSYPVTVVGFLMNGCVKRNPVSVIKVVDQRNLISSFLSKSE